MGFLESLVNRLLGDEAEEGEEALPVMERRTAVRLEHQIKVELKVEDEVIPSEICNLTFTGLSLSLPKKLEVGQQLTLLRDDLGPPFQGSVIWSKSRDDGYLVGVEAELDEEKLVDSWLIPALEEAGFTPAFACEQRKMIRRPSRTKCILSDGKGTTYYDVVMIDLSVGGALVECHQELEQGEKYKFRTEKPGFACLSVVRSVQPHESRWHCSLEFQEPDIEELKSFLRASEE